MANAELKRLPKINERKWPPDTTIQSHAPLPKRLRAHRHAPVVEVYRFHQGGRKQCPAYNMVFHNCRLLGHLVKVCRGRRILPPTLPAPNQEQRSTLYAQTQPTPHINASKSNKDNIIDLAPTIGIQITSLNGNAEVRTLPDSGADISVAGKAALWSLGEHEDNLLPSQIIPKAVNGTKMKPVGKLPVTFKLGHHKYVDDLHIYPEVSGVLLS